MAQSHHHGNMGTLPLRKHNVVHMAEAATAPIWSRVGDCSSGAQTSFIYVQHNHSANTLEVRTNWRLLKIQTLSKSLLSHARKVQSIVIPV